MQFDEGCIVLVGINESGKSNVLRALHTLDPNINVGVQDLRIERAGEEHVDHGKIEFSFDLGSEEIKRIYNRAKSHFISSHLEKPLVRKGNKEVGLAELCRMFGNLIWKVTIENNHREMVAWPESAEWSICPGWYINGNAPCPINLGNGREIIRPRSIVFNPKDFPEGFLKILTIDDLISLNSNPILNSVKNLLPQCIFWRYSDNNLLPSSIRRDDFIANPDCCVPLKSMFELADFRGQESISDAFKGVQDQPPHRYFQLLRRVSEAATKHVNNIWKDHKNIKIDLQPNGELLIPLIMDNSLSIDMASRSDGFKRFVSFLLMVSAKVRTTELNNILLLVDEPENALHPSGAKNLSQELINIGANNVVIYSTHSIFMIDKKNIARHRIVKRENGVTVLHKVEKSRMQDEEVIYSAIGYSIFDSLKLHNIVFEGWRDKEIFRVISEHMIKTDDPLASSIASWGTVHAEGVKDIKNVTKFLELAERDCLIVSDGDQPAKEKRIEFEKDRGWGKWITLPEAIGKEHIQTGEDLLCVEALIRKGNLFASTVQGLRHLVPSDFPDDTPCWVRLQNWIAELNLTKPHRDEKLNQLKSALYQDLAIEDLREDATTLVRHIASSIG